MDIIPGSANAYRQEAHYRRLKVLKKCRNAVPERDEFCRIRSVETLSPGLWITATFLDDTVRSFRPDKIRDATPEEVQMAKELSPVG